MVNPNEWVSHYGDYLFSLALLKTRNKETAEDLVQETFLSAIRSIKSFRGDSSEKTWLVSILNNKIIDHYRKKDILKNSNDYLIETEADFDGNFFGKTSVSAAHWKNDTLPQQWIAEADNKINNAEFKRVLEYCLSKLPAKLLPVFTAKYIDEDNSEKICKDLAISSSNFWVMIHRARLLMRSCLEINWIGKKNIK
jgi:RNA polymerase sigma-70 factor (TIGR02943 family)